MKVSRIFVLCALCNHLRSYLIRIEHSSVIRSWCRHRERSSVSGLRWSQRIAHIRREHFFCKSCSHYQIRSLARSSGRNGRVCVEDGRRRWPGEFLICTWNKACLSDPNAFISRHVKLPCSSHYKQHHRLGVLGRHGRWS